MLRRILYFIVAIVFVFAPAIMKAQNDTLKVMSYNTLNFGFPGTGGCPFLDPSGKYGYMRTIVQYEDPDILGFVKMTASPSTFSTDTIVNEILNPVCNGCYGHSPFTNNSGYTKENMLYYKTNKIGYISTTTIYSGDPNISDINLHKLYYKSPSLATTHDTVFLNVILIHDKSGDTDSSDRATELIGAIAWLNAHITAPGNYIFMGDFNTQSSNETCFQTLINSPNPNTRFYDPPNQLGAWADDPTAFANYLTQSTRINDPGDCGAVGGLEFRYDHILCTQPIMQGANSVAYVAGSFKVLGQDGNHTNLALTDPPTNTSAPANVINALYYMSNHLPVTLKLAVNESPAAVQQLNGSASKLSVSFNHLVTDHLDITIKGGFISNGDCQAAINNMEGQLINKQRVNINQPNTINTSGLVNGVYLLQILSNDGILFNGKFVKAAKE